MKKMSVLVVAFLILAVLTACTPDIDVETQNVSDNQGNSQFSENDETGGFVSPDPVFPEHSTSENVTQAATSDSRCFYGERTGTKKTATGLEPLPEMDFTLKDMENTSGLDSTGVPYGFGVAADEKPHNVSVQNQKFFDEKGFDAVSYDAGADSKVLYLTFDCGYENGYTAKILDVLKEKNVKAAFFCSLLEVRNNHDIIARMINEGHIVGNHSTTHPDFSKLSRQEIINEIKGFDDYLRKNFGYSSFYFRYPEGKYSENSLDAINELGYKCVFWSLAYSDWDINNQKGAAYAHDTVMARVHPGAVILLHAVSSDNAGALGDIIDSARVKGYEFKTLDELD